MQWGVAHGERVGKIIAITVRAAASAHTLALWELVRSVIRSDPAWLGGDYYTSNRPSRGIGLATALSLIQWMDADFMQARYGRARDAQAVPLFSLAPEFTVQKMMARVIEAGHASLDPNSLLYLTKAADYFDLNAGCSSLAEALCGAGGDYLLVSYERDPRYPVAETERLVQALRGAGRSASHVVLSNVLSHGAYLYDLAGLDTEVRAFLS
jgi:homoserine O-acetyltransferase/O-succinyltransferase